MEGMIWNANHVLEQALAPGVNGIPKMLFENCKGVVLISVLEAGFIFSGSLGTGIILAKHGDGSWSNPSACGISGLGWGLLVGGSVKDIIVFIMDETTLKNIGEKNGVRLGAQAELTVGPFGRSGKTDLDFSKQGVGATVSIAYTKGAFAGLSFNGGVVGSRDAVNALFYGKEVTANDILFGSQVKFPDNKYTLIKEVYDKLAKLSQGVTEESRDDDKKAKAREEADKAAERYRNDPDVVHIDAAAEAAKNTA
jgi:lipid-binding SYLF domain-containing protein